MRKRRPTRNPSRKPTRSRLTRRVFSGLVLLVPAWVAFEALRWPDMETLRESNPETTAFIERYRSRARQEGLPDPDRRWVPYHRISPHLKRAVLVAEDVGFFSHRGFAVEEIKSALREHFEDGKPLRGASTITQQLAKNLWLSPSRNPLRKLKEALLVVQVEDGFSKHRILELYLNVVEFGPGIYGAEAAAWRYFQHPAAELDAGEAAALAAGLPRPSRWHPGSTSPVYLRRVERISNRAANARWLDDFL